MRLPFLQGNFIKSGAIIFLATLLASVIAFATNLAISSMLGPEAFGNFKVIVYLFAFLPILADFGINSTLTKYISEFGRDSKKIGTLIRKLALVKGISLILIVALISLVFKDQMSAIFLQSASMGDLIIAGTFILVGNFIFMTLMYMMLGFQNFKTYGLSQVISSLISALAAIALLPFGIFLALVGWSAGTFVGSIPPLLFILRKKGGWGSESVNVAELIKKFSLPVYPIDMITNLFNAIVPIISLFFNQTLVGYYSFAFMFYFAAMLIPNSLSMVLFPKISELHGQKMYGHAKDILKKSLLYYTPIALAGIFITLALSDWFVGLVASSYLPSMPLFKMIVTLGFALGYNVIWANYLKGKCEVKKYALFMLMQNLILIAASFYLLGSMA